MKCEICKTPLKSLLTSTYCENEDKHEMYDYSCVYAEEMYDGFLVSVRGVGDLCRSYYMLKWYFAPGTKFEKGVRYLPEDIRALIVTHVGRFLYDDLFKGDK